MRRFGCFWLAVASACAVSVALAQYADPDSRFIMRVRVKDRASQIPILAEMQLDLAGIDVKADTADFVGDWKTYQRLRGAGFDPQIVWTSADLELQSLGQYLDPGEVSQKLSDYEAAYPALAKKAQIATTSEGRAEWALKISDNVNLEEDEPVVLYIGQHHAREVMTPEIALDIVDYLLTRYATDPRVKDWVDGREIWVVPSHNPDGANWVFAQYSFWRKNRRNNEDGTLGVDPNRNYPFHWTFCASGAGSSSSPGSDTYRGPSQGSEPETQGLMQLARSQHPALSLSYHTYSELVIHPYGCRDVVNAETRTFRDYSSDMAVRLRNDLDDGFYANGTPYELLYEVSGDSDGWLYGELGAFASTIEANSSTQGFQPDYNTWRDQTVLRNRPGWQFLLDRIDGPSIWGHTTNACTGGPLAATLGLDEIVFTNGETPRTSEPGFGRFHWLTTPGLWHLNVSKVGYAAQDWPVDVGFTATRREVRLVPSGSSAVEPLSELIQDGSGDADGEVDPGETVMMPVTVYSTGEPVSGLTGVLSTSDPYVTILDPYGSWPSIGAGGTAVSTDSFAFSVGAGAPEGHVISFNLAFTADQSLCSPASSFEVPVTTRTASCPAYSQPLDANPGWTIQNSDSLGWAFGPPGGTGGTNGPPAARTGAYVFGTNLGGSYGDSADYKLVTTPFNLALLRNTELRFWRWLNNEAGYDLASVDLSTDGVNFTNIWSGFGRDTRWELYRFDISAIADGQPTVYIRFRLQSDSSQRFSGLYIDDVSICGETVAPAPVLTVTSWSLNDGVNPSCADHDSYADGGETAELTVNLRNDGSAAANGTIAVLASSDPRIVMTEFRETLGSIPPGGTASSTCRFKVEEGVPCGAQVPFTLTLTANAGAYESNHTGIDLTLQADDGAPVPDTFEDFEGSPSWALTGEWQIGAPMGKGGTANGGSGTPDPSSAVSGTRVLGVDLTGLGTSLGNYENGLSGGITATSPVYDCRSSRDVRLEFKRWLGVESSQYDRAAVEVWTGSAWQTAWTNPGSSLSDASWQNVSLDVSPWADGNASFQVRFKLTSDASVVYCGWNIDDLRLTNGYIPQVCESGSCPAGCTPAAEIDNLTVTKSGASSTVTWSDSTSTCHGAGGAYRVYRSTKAARRTSPAAQWPQDSYFVDVTPKDLDGSASNPSYSEPETPPAGRAFFYLVVDMGTNGAEGAKGWEGL